MVSNCVFTTAETGLTGQLTSGDSLNRRLSEDVSYQDPTSSTTQNTWRDYVKTWDIKPKERGTAQTSTLNTITVPLPDLEHLRPSEDQRP